MCGIALVISGVSIDSSSLLSGSPPNSVSPQILDPNEGHVPVFAVDDLKQVLLRRGPDNLGSEKVYIQIKRKDGSEEEKVVSAVDVELIDTGGCFSQCLRSPCLSNKFMGEPALCEAEAIDFKQREETENEVSSFSVSESENDCTSSNFELSCTRNAGIDVIKSVAELHFLSATLQLRGISCVHQPLEDVAGNILIYNGEIFGGVDVGRDSNDAENLLCELARCCSCNCHGPTLLCCKDNVSVPKLLSSLRGPWALIYWQAKSKTIWFGRDAFGRRSLLVHWPTLDDTRFLLSSVSPPPSVTVGYAADKVNMIDNWEELSCGIYSICLDVAECSAHRNSQDVVGEVRKHEWVDTQLKKLIKWERIFVEPKLDEVNLDRLSLLRDKDTFHSGYPDAKPFVSVSDNLVEKPSSPLLGVPHSFLKGSTACTNLLEASKVVSALRQSVMRRTTLDRVFLTTGYKSGKGTFVPVAVLFSGGLDSMIISALLDQCLDTSYAIDLLNVSFDGELAPDRLSARAGVKELRRIAPTRRWCLVEIDADLSSLAFEMQHVWSLIQPAKTYMDLNIGLALWLAAGGDGWLDEGSPSHHHDHQRFKYKSEAKILLVGSGADEQCAGYGRHKTRYRSGGWLALGEEMKLDMQRIWKRNLGRDDRCISDNGKEARFPFLDEDVIETLLDTPLWKIAELDRPVGEGDKKILREVAFLLGLEEAARLPKRAIQFGSRIARESNRKNFGSNRAANQASAGSVVVHNLNNNAAL